MAEVHIITPDDIREYYPQLSVNISDERVNSSILLAQQNDLEAFLGYYLYAAMIEDYDGNVFDKQIYQDLYDGGTYTDKSESRYHRGIKHLLCVYSFISLIASSLTFINDFLSW